MKKFSILILVLFVALSMNAQTIVGVWNTGKDNTKVKITKVNDIYNGKIHSSDNPKAKIGNPILKDVKFSNGKGKGKIYAAKKGKWYEVILEESGDKLNVTIKVGFKSKTLTWEKE